MKVLILPTSSRHPKIDQKCRLRDQLAESIALAVSKPNDAGFQFPASQKGGGAADRIRVSGDNAGSNGVRE